MVKFNKLRIVLLFCAVAGSAILLLDFRSMTIFQPEHVFRIHSTRFSDGQPDQGFHVNLISAIKKYVPISLCKPVLSLVFIKTHKTGSTTMSSVINRFGASRNLSFLLYNQGHGHFRQDILKNISDLLPPRSVHSGEYDLYRNYDVMTSHVRFLPNIEFLRRYMKPGTKAVTVLREPTQQWESAYLFFNCAQYMQILKKNASEKFNIFFSDPMKYWNETEDSQCKYYTRNGMWYDLSSNEAIHTDKSEVYRELDVLDQNLDLVLITEYLDESLLLLKRLMCWDYEDILYVTLNQRNTTSQMTDTHRAKIREWNMADVILYDYYNLTLWEKVKDYGPSFKEDLDHFRTLREDYMKWCGIGDTLTERSKHRIGFVAHNTSILCQSLVREDNSNILIQQQTL